MKSWKIDRRTFLKGAGGVALALPLLDVMADSSKSATPPKRLACVFIPNGVTTKATSDWCWFPKGEGKDFIFNKSLASLEPVRSDLSIIGGLSHPEARNFVPHATAGSFLTSSMSQSNISIDQAYAQVASRHTRAHSLILSLDGGMGSTNRTRTISYSKYGQPIAAENDIRRLFNRMFVSNSLSKKEARKALIKKKSMVDLILENAKSLNKNLGVQDKKKLEEYLDSVREIERRVERADKWLDTPMPKVDPKAINLTAERSKPEDYFRAFYDLMFLAFQTDTTRAATFQNGNEGDGGSDDIPLLMGYPLGHHQMSHQAGKRNEDFLNYARYDQFLAQHFSYFLKKLKDSKEGEGNMLDNTLVLYGSTTSALHLGRNYPLILAGGKGFGLKHGQYHKFDESEHRMSDLLVTMLNSLGVKGDTFGDSKSNMNDVLLA
jgi:hypothetical protein